jgi:integrase
LRLLIAEIETDDVLACLKPIWQTKAETASRVRGRIERVLDAAAARGLRSRDNPARWRGHLANLLPKRQKLARGHHAAMPFDDVPAFVSRLREVEGVSPDCDCSARSSLTFLTRPHTHLYTASVPEAGRNLQVSRIWGSIETWQVCVQNESFGNHSARGDAE